MKVESFFYPIVDEEGNTYNEAGVIDGNVNTEAGVTVYPYHCENDECLNESGYWICVNYGLDKKSRSVNGITIFFDTEEELNNWLTDAIERHILMGSLIKSAGHA